MVIVKYEIKIQNYDIFQHTHVILHKNYQNCPEKLIFQPITL